MSEHVIETARLKLNRLTPDDAAFILSLVNDKDWLRFIGDKNIHDLAAAEDYIRTGPMRMYRPANDRGMMRISLADDDTPVGICGIIDRDGLEDVDLGFALLPAYRSAGFAREASIAVLDKAFESPRLARIAAITLPHNLASIALLTSLGFRFEESVRLPGDKDILSLFGLTRAQHRRSSGAMSR